MDVELLKTWFSLDNIMELIREYRSFGPIPGIVLPMLEAFLPFLPLFLFVMANASAFGLWLGFLYSWIGAVAGAWLVFMVFRKFGQKRLLFFLHKHQTVRKLMVWVERHGFGPLFLMLCFPFTPSAIVNIVAGLSKVSVKQYMLAVVAGKMVMVFSISFIGHDIHSLFTQPLRTLAVLVVIFTLWLAGKQIERRITFTAEKRD